MNDIPARNTPKNANNNPPNGVSMGKVTGPSTVNGGSGADYNCSYNSGEGSVRGTRWSISPNFGSISSSGYYTAPQRVAVDTEVTVKFSITAGRPGGQSWGYSSSKTITVLSNAAMFVGEDLVTKAYVGNTSVDKAYLGSTRVF